jgi:hypothetical protein
MADRWRHIPVIVAGLRPSLAAVTIIARREQKNGGALAMRRHREWTFRGHQQRVRST